VDDPGVDAEPNADSGGALANEEPDNQESANIAHGEEPRTHAQAMASPDIAECYELDQLAHLDTYDLTLLPHDRQEIGSYWVCKIKHDSNGDIVLYCACLVAWGFTQHSGEDFFVIFTPVAK
jgi:hypothetical protein